MKRTSFLFCVVILFTIKLWAHSNPELHINTKYKECSFQIDSSLTQKAFNQFTKEAGLVVYFRPLISAEPMGKGRLELSLLQWKTGIDEGKDAWNNTFVHPDSTHWLVGGPMLPIPGLTFRMGLTNKLDLGLFWTMSPGANYGFTGAQLQYNLYNNSEKGIAAAGRLSMMRLYGPQDINHSVYGVDAIISKKINLNKSRLSIAPYLNGSVFCASAKEKSNFVELKNASEIGCQISAGAVLNVGVLRLGAEYNFATVNSLSFKIGFSHQFRKVIKQKSE